MIRRRRPRPRRKGRVAELKRDCDKLWTQNVLARAGSKCECCGTEEYVQAHHICPRQHYATRFELENGLGLCRNCHFWVHYHLPAEDRAVFYRKYGRNYEALRQRSRLSAKGTDYELVKVFLTRTLGEK